MLAYTALLYVSVAGAALAQQETAPLCIELHRLVDGQASPGGEEAASALQRYSSNIVYSPEEARCAGIVYGSRAAFIGASGRIAEAEPAAERSLAILENLAGIDPHLLLRALHTLVIIRLELGKTTKAWQAYRKMLAIHSTRPEDRAMVHDIAATLLHASGKLKQCALEYRVVLQAMDDGGHGNSANAGSTLTVLALVYSEDHRLDEAQRALDRATAILQSAEDTMPLDRIRVLHVRGVLYKQRRQWADAERVLREAVTLAENQKLLESVALSSLWTDFAAVLRRTHRRDEARGIEARASAFRAQPGSDSSIDVSELAVRK